MDTRPGQGTAVALSELVILDLEAVFSTLGASVLYPYAVITVPSPVFGRACGTETAVTRDMCHVQ